MKGQGAKYGQAWPCHDNSIVGLVAAVDPADEAQGLRDCLSASVRVQRKHPVTHATCPQLLSQAKQIYLV